MDLFLWNTCHDEGRSPQNGPLADPTRRLRSVLELTLLKLRERGLGGTEPEVDGMKESRGLLRRDHKTSVHKVIRKCKPRSYKECPRTHVGKDERTRNGRDLPSRVCRKEKPYKKEPRGRHEMFRVRTVRRMERLRNT